MYSRTSLILNQQSKQLGLEPYYYRCRNCDTNLTSNVPADQYQRLKLIQKTVRVASSLYTMNLGALTSTSGGVSWNQMSDREVPSVQKSIVPSTKSTRHSTTSSRPGGQNPGGIGCDIKHNSYERRLNRLKGKAILKRGPVPANFGDNIVSTCANPVSGGKTMKTNIITSCVCSTANQDRLYIDPNNYNLNSLKYVFVNGQEVYAIKTGYNYYSVATIIDVYDDGRSYLVQFADLSEETKLISELRIYYECVCLD